VRLFLALWPADHEQAQAAAVQAAITWPHAAKLVAHENLHLTLHFLGEVDANRVPVLRNAPAARAGPLSLTLDRFAVWDGGISVLEPSTVPAELLDLHAALGHQLRSADFEIERRRFRPHVTLARRGQGAAPKRPIGQITWRASSYALVESAGGKYSVLQEWQLRG
jgi:2'-5' RNA ligase